MISRRISRKPNNDNYRRLANYIGGARHEGEKCLLAWCAGCWAGDDYELAIQEVADTQALNTRSTKEKTYHLVISFRPEDEAKLTPEAFQALELAFAKALGFEEHQRHCGVHRNTANLHMHVAYNMIHPERLTRHEPFRDFHTRDRVCRELEQRFGLAIDNGRGQAPQEQAKLRDAAATVEAHTGEQSFEGYAKERRSAILAALEDATDWHDLHHALALHGLELKPHGNGLVLKDRHGRHAIKASATDRILSKPSLEKRFSPFQAPAAAISRVESRERYRARPLHLGDERGAERGKLYATYRAGIERRKANQESLKRERQARFDKLASQWRETRQEIEKMALTRRDRFALLRLAREHEAKARRKLAQEMADKRRDMAREFPCTSWKGFLRWREERGRELSAPSGTSAGGEKRVAMPKNANEPGQLPS